MKIENHRLTNAELSYNSPNITSGSLGLIEPRIVVWHWTGGWKPGPAINTFMNPRSKVSAHLVIDRKGEIAQLVDFNRKAWHAGKSEWNGQKGVNSFSIGIELVNAGGPLKKNTEFGTYTNGTYSFSPSEVQFFEGKPYHRYTEAQINAAKAVARLICQNYDIEAFVGHQDVSPGRKNDPGPVFPLKELWDFANSENFEEFGNNFDNFDQNSENSINSAEIGQNSVNLAKLVENSDNSSKLVLKSENSKKPVFSVSKKAKFLLQRFWGFFERSEQR